jgi:hypothetical protein
LAPTSSRPLMAKSSPMHGTLSSYVVSTPSFSKSPMYLWKIVFLKWKVLSLSGSNVTSSLFKWHPTPTAARGRASLRGWQGYIHFH